MRDGLLAWEADGTVSAVWPAVLPPCAWRATLARSALAVRVARPRAGAAVPAGIAIVPIAAAAALRTGRRATAC